MTADFMMNNLYFFYPNVIFIEQILTIFFGNPTKYLYCTLG